VKGGVLEERGEIEGTLREIWRRLERSLKEIEKLRGNWNCREENRV
jgi:hypothetical protein